MLDSARFAGDNFYVNQNEYDGLAIGCALLIISTIVYYVLTVVLELTVSMCPRNIGPVMSVVSCCCRGLARKKMEEATLKARGRKSLRSAAAEGAGGASSDLQVNPMAMRAHAASDPAFDGSGLVDAEQVRHIDQPTSAMWRAVQSSYVRLTGMLDALQGDIRELKKKGDTGPTANAGTLAGARNRRQFQPVIRAEEEEEEATSPSLRGLSGGRLPSIRSLGSLPGTATLVNPLAVGAAETAAVAPAQHVAGLSSFAALRKAPARKPSNIASALGLSRSSSASDDEDTQRATDSKASAGRGAGAVDQRGRGAGAVAKAALGTGGRRARVMTVASDDPEVEMPVEPSAHSTDGTDSSHSTDNESSIDGNAAQSEDSPPAVVNAESPESNEDVGATEPLVAAKSSVSPRPSEEATAEGGLDASPSS